MTVRTALPLTVSEAVFQRAVIDLALLTGWRVHHSPPSMVRGRHLTVGVGHPGLPDLILAKGGRVLLVELKRQQGRATPGQRLWLAAAGEHGRLWRPSDMPEIRATLTGTETK